MFRAFVSACLTDVGAEAADCFHVSAVARHCRCGKLAKVGTILTKRHTARQHLDVGFLRAASGAIDARCRASVACFNASLVFLVNHLISFV